MKSKTKTKEHNQLVRGALIQLFGLQLRSGMTAQELSALALECVADAERSADSSARSAEKLFEAQDYGSVLRTWHRESSYLSPTGLPRPLGIAGKFGLRNLIQRYYPREHYRRVLLTLRGAGLIREQTDGKWLPTKKCAVFPRLNDELMTHVAEGISKLVQTVNQNVTSQRKDALFERSAKVRRFPVCDTQAFRTFVNAQAAAFLGTVDDWLESHSLPTRTSKRAICTAGVFSFAFIDEPGQGSSRSDRNNRNTSLRRRLRRSGQLIPQRPS